jgi:WD40 repeat protein
VAAAGYGTFCVGIWDVASGAPTAVLRGHSWVVAQIAFSPDGRLLASGSSDGSVRVWDVEAGREIDTPPLGHTLVVTGVAFSPDGKQLASVGMDRTVRVWDTTDWKLVRLLRDPTGGALGVTFSSDGRRLAWGGTDATVKVWDLPAERKEGVNSVNPLIHTLRGHTNWVQCVAFSPDSKQIASASADGTVKIWKLPPVAEPPGGEASDQDP